MKSIDELLAYYKGKKVLITGHTGFKGSWLTIWLHKLGAEVIGYGLDTANPSGNYMLSGISSKIKSIRDDIRNREKLINVFEEEKPEIIFHLAAQALVIDAYKNPIKTYETNTMGTANVLEAIRLSNSIHTAIFITTDKVYDNKEHLIPYREEDRLGGYDPYSSSKGAAELIIASYRNSFFNPKLYEKHKKSIASVRAGNVIGGGDWAENRIIPDCIRAIENDKIINVRNPNSVRPWQHVLEPLGAYLLLGAKMMDNPVKYGDAWNFGPNIETTIPVKILVEKLIENYGSGKWNDTSEKQALHEANLLILDINKAKKILSWNPVLNFQKTVGFTIDWYKNYKKTNVLEMCNNQIEEYTRLWILKSDI
ncbi:MAG: CDP-glucose 4,6-dehydratase [Saprospiraceae bacterium]|nr:CDP-glucose 4,6-dehydratase [Saprospiraceae bacterium]